MVPFDTTPIDLRPLLLRDKKRLPRERDRGFESLPLRHHNNEINTLCCNTPYYPYLEPYLFPRLRRG